MTVEIKKILVVDDDPLVLNIIEETIKYHKIEVVTSTSGEDGLAAAIIEKPDLILLDVDMAAMDGYEVCRHLKINPDTAEIPVIFLTAREGDEDREKSRDVGAAGFMSKPFEYVTLPQQLQAILAESNS